MATKCELIYTGPPGERRTPRQDEAMHRLACTCGSGVYMDVTRPVCLTSRRVL